MAPTSTCISSVRRLASELARGRLEGVLLGATTRAAEGETTAVGGEEIEAFASVEYSPEMGAIGVGKPPTASPVL